MSRQGIDISEFKRELAIQNLKRLSEYEPPEPPHGIDYNRCNVGLEILKKWSNDNKSSIDQAISNQVFGGKQPINWKTAFLPFMESSAVYLRDWGLLRQAWKAYREYKLGHSNNPEKLNSIVSTYMDAYYGIEELAKTWNMEFVPLCDPIYKHPDGHLDWDGPYCGAFCTTDYQEEKPFIGVAFKGTNPLNTGEVSVDYNYQLFQDPKWLNNVQVSQGVLTGLFGTFEPPYDLPYTFILNQLEKLAHNTHNTAGGPVRTHVTSHSLGGSYSSFCYAQLLIDIAPESASFIVIGDEYTFGAPRVGSQAWSDLNTNVVGLQEGQSWRIVNDQDLVPRVPPTDLKKDQLNFYHIDNGMKIYKDKIPTEIPSERGGPPPPPYEIKSIQDFINTVIAAGYHLPNSYETAMVYAIKNT